jgi:DNA-binding transcriptional ArsR family regulator
MSTARLQLIEPAAPDADLNEARLDEVFAALADPVRRAILMRLEDGEQLVSEIAAPFAISLQAVSRHIQVLVRAGLVRQERSGRISRCRLDAGPIYGATVWLSRYSRYWQTQFDTLAAWLTELDRGRRSRRRAPRRAARTTRK